jgi:DNA-directed RNA polymerase specialized sigma24 family protein
MADVIEVKRPRSRRHPASGTDSPVHEVLDAQEGFLARVLEMLSHHERMALRLRHRDGLAPGAIAARMKLPESIVADLLAQAERTVRLAQRAFIDALAEHAPAAARR